MKGPWALCLSCLLAVSIASACGGEGGSKASDEDSASGTSVSEPARGAAGLDPCALVTDEQVATVLPGHDGGFVAKAGGSLVEGIDAYQCSYSTDEADLLTVILNVAVDEERFETLKPSSLVMGDAREIDVGDRGWVRGEYDDMKVTVLKGLTRIDLELMSSNAGDKADALVDLARAVANRAE